jgi:hypothetical protein
MPHLDQTKVIFNWRTVLKAENNGRAPLLPSRPNIGRGTGMNNQLWICSKAPIPLFNIGDRFPKGLMVGNGDVHRINIALPHLSEYFFRPRGVL